MANLNRCWLSIHWSPPDDQKVRELEYDNKVWVKTQGRHWINDFRDGDTVFVYETASSPAQVEVIGQNGERLDYYNTRWPSRGGLIAVLRIHSQFVPNPYIERAAHVTGENVSASQYLGYFKGEMVTSRFIPLCDIKDAWSRELRRCFIPRTNGGLRPLSHDECRVLKRLAAV